MNNFKNELNNSNKHGIDMSDSDFAMLLGYAENYGHGTIFNTRDFSDMQDRLDDLAIAEIREIGESMSVADADRADYNDATGKLATDEELSEWDLDETLREARELAEDR